MNGAIIPNTVAKGERVAITNADTTYYQFMNPNQYTESYYIDRGDFRFFSMAIKCNSPQNDWYILGDRLYTSPYYSLFPPFAIERDTGDVLPILVQNGYLYVKGGTAGKTYSISFVIPK